MNPIEENYNKSFFFRRKSLEWRAPIICKAIESTFSFSKKQSIIDVGCAIGEYVKEFINMGYTSFGIEGSIASREFSLTEEIAIIDIRKPLDDCLYSSLKKRFDLCISLEVAEHIEEEYANIYVDNLCYLSNSILLSAATPGQEGHCHFNCQPKEYWEIKFRLRRYLRDIKAEKIFRSLLEEYKRKKGISGYYFNTMIFRRFN